MKEQDRKKRKKKFTWAASASVALFQLTLFGGIWLSYYNDFAFRTHRAEGAVVVLLAYCLVYDRLARLYKAYKIGQYSIGETIFSQLLSFGIADLFFYVECCLVSRGYVDIRPGAAAVAIQFLGTVVWAVASKRYYMEHIPAPETVLIHGSGDVETFTGKLLKYKHLFHISKKMAAGEALPALTKAVEKAEVVILYGVTGAKKEALLTYCVDHVKTLYITPDITDILVEGFENRHLTDTPLMKYDYNPGSFWNRAVKRAMDVAVALFGLIVTLPITLVTMAAIKLEDGGSIFFRQERYTLGWKKFHILKFRSMVMDAEKDGARLCTVGDSRVTRVGAVIRRFRIDEIPQLVNVLAGDMSLVGPRPERVENMEKYTDELPQFAYRLRVKGGLTGYAQLYGKYNTSAEDKLKLDLMYIENQGILMDLKLIMLTLKVLFIPESTEGFAQERVADLKKTGAKEIVYMEKVKGVS